MEFTYDAYISLIHLLKQKGYRNASYLDHEQYNKVFILRHDIDCSLEKALQMANIEKDLEVKATYFALVSTGFYNILSKSSNELLKQITCLGHEIGLHFDEKRYQIESVRDLERYIEYEKNILEGSLGKTVQAISMHRPSEWILKSNHQFKGLINTYSKEFFFDYKYLSDSRMHWREDIIGIIQKGEYERLHILTHPFWYSEDSNDIKNRLKCYIHQAKQDRNFQLKDNIRNIEDLLLMDDIR